MALLASINVYYKKSYILIMKMLSLKSLIENNFLLYLLNVLRFVLQESVLAFLLFLIYVNDMSQSLALL